MARRAGTCHFGVSACGGGESGLYALEEAFDTAEVPLNCLVESHLFSELLRSETGLDRSPVVQLLLPHRVLDEAKVSLVFGESFELVDEFLGFLGVLLEDLVADQVVGGGRDVVTHALEGEVDKEADADGQEDNQVHNGRSEEEFESEVVFEREPIVSGPKVEEVVSDGGEEEVTGWHMPVDLLVLDEDLGCDDEYNASKHCDSHGPEVAGLAVSMQNETSGEGLGRDEEGYQSFVQSSDHPPEECVLVKEHVSLSLKV